MQGGANEDSIGICLVGDGEPPPTNRQMLSLITLCISLCDSLGIPSKNILGHRDVCDTECPGIYLYASLPIVRTMVQCMPREHLDMRARLDYTPAQEGPGTQKEDPSV